MTPLKNCLKSPLTIGILFVLICSSSRAQEGIQSKPEEGQPLAENRVDENHSRHDLKRGESLFYGLVSSGDNLVNCASCHNTAEIDTLNWNPSAMDIIASTAQLDSAHYADLILNPITRKLTEAHADIELTGEEVVLIRNYLNEWSHTGLKPRKPDVSRTILFIFTILLSVAAITDLTITKLIRWKAIPYFLLIISAVWGTKMIVHEAIALGRSRNYAPMQPIKFSHAVHAGEDQIDCQYCHHTAETSKSAGIPSMDVCMNCHIIIRDGTRSGQFEIKKILSAMEDSVPVEWVRIHRLPDFVFFSHAQHVGAGKLDCVECHGVVEEMDVLQQYSDLSMGWCLDCHRTRKVNFIENDYYNETYLEYHDKITRGLIDSVTVEQIGGTDCMKCHY